MDDEKILWIVEKTNVYSGNVSSRWVFRTRSAAIRFKVMRHNANTNPDIVFYRKRGTWGPDNATSTRN